MRIVFARAATESLGLEYLSAALKARGHETFLVYEPLLFDSFRLRLPFFEPESAARTAARIVSHDPGLIGFSAESDHFGWALAVAREVKRLSRAPVIFGGVHPSTAPEAALARPEIDMVCVADGEAAVCGLADRLEKGLPIDGLHNVWFKRGGEAVKNTVKLATDLDALPFPDKDLFFREYPGFIADTYSIVTGRGCPNACTRPQNSEIGIHGEVDVSSPGKRIGYTLYLGGAGGRSPRAGFKLEKVFTEDETLVLVEKVVSFFKNNAKPRQRLFDLMDETGMEKFLEEIKI